jgi:hypothetical protein
MGGYHSSESGGTMRGAAQTRREAARKIKTIAVQDLECSNILSETASIP